MLSKVKLALRINSDDFDTEINSLINACKKELELAGIASSKIVETDDMIVQAVTNYCKANFGFDNNEAERFLATYNSIKSFLCLCQSYINPPTNNN